MDSSSRLASARQEGSASSRKRRTLPGWVQILIGLPLTLLSLSAVMVLALPDLLRKKARGWDRFGDH